MRLITFLKGAAIGAGLMYLFDPSQGRGRRSRIRDNSVRVWNDTGDAIESKTRDIANRMQGVLHSASTILSPAARHQMGADASIPRWMPSKWSPTTRMLVTAGAGLLAFYGKRRGGILGTALGAVSVGIITNSVAASELSSGFAGSPALLSDYVDSVADSDPRYAGSLSEHLPRAARSY